LKGKGEKAKAGELFGGAEIKKRIVKI